MNARIDFAAVRSHHDLRRVIEGDLGPPLRHHRWACPWHHGEHANLGVSPDGKTWKCWTCGACGTVIDWVMRRDNLTALEAAAKLEGVERHPKSSRLPSVTRPIDSPSPAHRPASRHPERPWAWHDPGWQSALDDLIRHAEEALWSPVAYYALDWLRARGLQDHTISRFRLGWISADLVSEALAVLGPDAQGHARRLRASRGITIPWLAPESWYGTGADPQGADPGPRWVGCNVRRLDRGPKYRALAGSSRGYPYPDADVAPGVPCLVCEGELDALLAWQEAGWLVNVLTLGGAQQTPQPEALRALAECPLWLLAFDHDQAGNDAVRSLSRLAPPKCRRLYLPDGKDITEFVQGGGNLCAWLRSEWARFFGD